MGTNLTRALYWQRPTRWRARLRTDHHNLFFGRFTEPEDLERFQTPTVSYDRETSEHRLALLHDVFADILPVRLTGVRHIWFAPWDNLYRLVDTSRFMFDMIDRPAFLDAMMARYVDASLAELDQMQALGLLSPGNANVRVGSGGYAYIPFVFREAPSHCAC